MGGSQSSEIRKVLERNNINKETILGSVLMERMMADLGTDPNHLGYIPSPVAKTFLHSLFKELDVPCTKSKLKEVLNACRTKEPVGYFDVDTFRLLVSEIVPEAKLTNSLLVTTKDLEQLGEVESKDSQEQFPKVTTPIEDSQEKQEVLNSPNSKPKNLKSISSYMKKRGISNTSIVTQEILNKTIKEFAAPNSNSCYLDKESAVEVLYYIKTSGHSTREEIAAKLNEEVNLRQLQYFVKQLRPRNISSEILLSTLNEPAPRGRNLIIADFRDEYTAIVSSIGFASIIHRYIPGKLPKLMEVQQLQDIVGVCAAPWEVFYFLDRTGHVYSYCSGNVVEIEECTTHIVSISSSASYLCMVDISGSVWTLLHSGTRKIEKIPINDTIVSAHCGINCTLLLGDRGCVWIREEQVGKGKFAQLIKSSNISTIACGRTDVLFLLDDGTVYLSGTTGLARSPTLIPNLPFIKDVYCKGGSSFLVDNDGQAWYFGYCGNNSPTLCNFPSPVVAISQSTYLGEDNYLYAINVENGQQASRLPEEFVGTCGYRIEKGVKSARK